MGKHNETGRSGERIAEEYLIKNGYSILHRNWRTAHKEIDLVALEGSDLVFVEIKTRSGTAYGFPEEAVSLKKQAHLRAAATIFMEQYPEHTVARFDVISIMMRNGSLEDLLHLRDAF